MSKLNQKIIGTLRKRFDSYDSVMCTETVNSISDEIISLCMDDAIEAVKSRQLPEPTVSKEAKIMNGGYRDAIKAIEKLKQSPSD